MMKPCCNKFVNVCLLVLNFGILGLGVCVSAFGVYVKYFTELLDGYITPLVKIIPSGGGTEQDVYTLYNGNTLAFMGIGFLMLVVGLFGCTLSASTRFVGVYAVLMTSLIFIQLTVLGILAGMEVDEKLHETLLSNFVNKYKGDEAIDDYSRAWNYIFVEFECCAVTDYRDFLFCYWDRQKTINNETIQLEVAVTCCKLPGEYPDFGQPYDSNCTQAPTIENSYIWTGCTSEVDDYMLKFRYMMMLASFGPILLEVASAVLTIWLQYVNKRDKRMKEKLETERETPPWIGLQRPLKR